MRDEGEQARQLFTVEEANLRLPLVKVIVQDIVTLFTDLHDRKERLTELRNRSEQSEYRDEVEAMENELETDIETLDAFVAELRIGKVAVEMDIPELGFAIEIGEVEPFPLKGTHREESARSLLETLGHPVELFL